MGQQRTGGGAAFVKGGVGCILAFLVIGAFFVLFGGYMYLDLGGVLLLFVIGGVIGLIVNAIYRKGASDAGGSVAPPESPTDDGGRGGPVS